MRNRWTFGVLTLALAIFIISSVAPKAAPVPPAPTLTTLQPGGFRVIPQTLDVNIVFVGYELGAPPLGINLPNFSSILPSSYRPIHRYPNFYGIRQEMGLTFNYNYRVTFADSTYENTFFTFLAANAVSKPLTLYQNQYNAEAPRARTLVGNTWIDAPTVEKWLAEHPPAGVNTSKYTIYFINWYGRADFVNHVYTKLNEPDPDTGYNFGDLRQSRKMIAWGGTATNDPQGALTSTARVWFYDLSAGPESWSDNWSITTADIDGDGTPDYRLPPSWEYGNPNAGLYRPFNDISRDLGRVARFVALDLLFTTSPLYKPMISPPEVPNSLNVDFNVYQANPGSDGLSFLKPGMVTDKLGVLQSMNQFTSDTTAQPFTARAAAIYKCFVADVSCYGNKLFGIAFGDLFLYHNDHLTQFIEGDGDYEVPVFLYNATDALSAGGLLGFADDNWTNGTQSYVFGFVAPFLNAVGYGFTTTSIHEVGHHLGMSHPHDGYDASLDLDYDALGSMYFANSGDESNSIMSYIDLNWDFGQFDQDNMGRYLTSGYINQANDILARVYATGRAGEATSTLNAADANAAGALAAYGAMNYQVAATRAMLAYRGALAAASQVGVKIEPQSYTADYKAKGKSPKFIDTVSYKRLAP